VGVESGLTRQAIKVELGKGVGAIASRGVGVWGVVKGSRIFTG
jgi:hypothetical protein